MQYSGINFECGRFPWTITECAIWKFDNWAITIHGVEERNKIESKAMIAMNKRMLNLVWNAKAHRVLAYSGTIRRHRRIRCADEVAYANKCER